MFLAAAINLNKDNSMPIVKTNIVFIPSALIQDGFTLQMNLITSILIK